MTEHMNKICQQKRVAIDADNLRWTPLVQLGNPGNIMKDHESNSEDEAQKMSKEKDDAKQHSDQEEVVMKTRRRKKRGVKAAVKLDSEESAEEKVDETTVSCFSSFKLLDDLICIRCFKNMLIKYTQVIFCQTPSG